MNTPDLTKLRNKKLFLFDIDGTLAVGDTLYPGSVALLKHIESIGGKSYFITNNSTRSNADYVQKFRNTFHLETTEDLFITSGYITITYLKEHYANQKIFVLGTKSFVTELQKNDLQITEQYESDIQCLVAAYDSELTYDKLTEACKVLSTMDVPFYATNPDLCCPIDFGFIPDCGAICEMLTHSTGKAPIYLGKPSPEIIELCLLASGFTKEETLVVGDRLYTDIACGINAGVDTCVLFTGETQKEDLTQTLYPPTYSFENIEALWRACL
ncbi:MAG: HAD-IIA family hydrolase [Lachnospiraceae bacterium]|nr:HAD-IIA family hydrolase [Lachnospiraceae bacterium]